jgi:hypothetical protein
VGIPRRLGPLRRLRTDAEEPVGSTGPVLSKATLKALCLGDLQTVGLSPRVWRRVRSRERGAAPARTVCIVQTTPSAGKSSFAEPEIVFLRLLSINRVPKLLRVGG